MASASDEGYRKILHLCRYFITNDNQSIQVFDDFVPSYTDSMVEAQYQTPRSREELLHAAFGRLSRDSRSKSSPLANKITKMLAWIGQGAGIWLTTLAGHQAITNE
jgi:hypothetical protein